ncbi:MAG: hypothetical protein KF770_28055 [Anaerolineae bacterium]|nr:hypothetical protein [Anaerolineae bacterium]
MIFTPLLWHGLPGPVWQVSPSRHNRLPVTSQFASVGCLFFARHGSLGPVFVHFGSLTSWFIGGRVCGLAHQHQPRQF